MTPIQRTQIVVSPEFRALIAERFPDVFEETRYARLFQELLFPRWRDDLTRDAVLSRSLLAELEGQQAQLSGNKYVGQRFLDDFCSHTGVHLRVREADWLQGRARTAALQLSSGLELMLSMELLQVGNREVVDFVTGKPASRRRQERQRSERRGHRRGYEPPPGPNAHWITLLNHTPPHVFAQFEEFTDQAVDVANTAAKAERRHANLRTLHTLRQNGLDPAYKAVERSPRIYTSGISTAHLSSNVRAVQLATSLHFDLAAAQLAIIARLWNLPMIEDVLQKTLRAGGSVWSPLLALTGLKAEDKGLFKRLIYATAYGMGRFRLRSEAAEWFGLERARGVLNSPLMVELMRGREERLRRLKAEGGIEDAFGQRVSLLERAKRKWKAPENSLMAHEAQSYELLLMQPALEIAKQAKDFRIVLWLHDGFYAAVTKADRESRVARQVREQVDDQAKRLGLATRLVGEKMI